MIQRLTKLSVERYSVHILYMLLFLDGQIGDCGWLLVSISDGKLIRNGRSNCGSIMFFLDVTVDLLEKTY